MSGILRFCEGAARKGSSGTSAQIAQVGVLLRYGPRRGRQQSTRIKGALINHIKYPTVGTVVVFIELRMMPARIATIVLLPKPAIIT